MLKTVVPVSVCIPTIPPRSAHLVRSLLSVTSQTALPNHIIAECDYDRLGACGNRNKALKKVTDDYVAFLDDDDVFYPNHLDVLYKHIIETGADVVYSIMVIKNQNDDRIPHEGVFGANLTFNRDELFIRNYVPVTVLAKTSKLNEVGGFEHLPDTYGEDHGLWIKLLRNNCVFSHVPVETWQYNWWGHGSPGQLGNTSGLPSRW